MRNTINGATIAALLITGSTLVGQAFGAPADDARALAEKAVAHIREVGETTAFKDFQNKDGGYIAGELYVFCNTMDGIVLAHGGNPALVGKNFLHIKDPDGKEPIAAMNDLAAKDGSGWYEYKWPNPATKKIEPKAAYVLKINDYVCGVGYYKS